MREIQFKPGTRAVTRERVSAIAWATNRRGRNPWTGQNVAGDIKDYLARHGYAPEVDRFNWMRTALEAIKANNLGYLKTKEVDGGRHIVIEFNFHDDINLNGHGLPERAARERHGDREAHRPGPVVITEAHPNDTQTQTLQEDFPGSRPVVQSTGFLPPIPGAQKPAPYRLDEFVKVLTDWSERAPEDYAGWVEAAIESLRANT